jgi:hypothetical protein
MERKYNVTKFMVIVFHLIILLVNIIFSKVSAIIQKSNCGSRDIIIALDNTGRIGSLYCNNNNMALSVL